MSVTIYHNPRCSKSRKTLDLIRAQGIEPTVVEYLKTPLDIKDIQSLYGALKLDSPLGMIRVKDDAFKSAPIDKNSSYIDLIKALSDNPRLLERPIVTTNKATRICRPPELVLDIL